MSIKHDSEQLTEHSIPVEMPNSMSDRLRNANESQNSISNLPSGQPRSSATVKCAPTDKITHSYQEPNYGSSCSGNFIDFEFNTKVLHISNLNVRHLLPKLDELRIMLASKNGPDIFGLCETFLNQNIPDNLLSINGYQFVRKDRCCTIDKAGGGVILYLRSSINCQRRKEIEISKLETLWTEISFTNS